MQINQLTFTDNDWALNHFGEEISKPDLIMCYGSKSKLTEEDRYRRILEKYPDTTMITCSTAGEIDNEATYDESMVATAISFNRTRIQPVMVNIKDFSDSLEAGQKLVEQLDPEGLKFIYVLSDGQLVNGSDLVEGINKNLDNTIPVAGGLAGDGSNFQQTLVGINDNLAEGNIVAIGFYGENFHVGFGSKGGWDQFGPTRVVTKAEKNVLYEIDDQNALELYTRYLGDYAKDLPGSALLFPLSISIEGEDAEVVRTILSIDDKNQSMTFAGNIPVGSRVRLMKANFDNLVEAAAQAAEDSSGKEDIEQTRLALLISCVGRRLIFGNRIEEEFEAAKEILGPNTVLTGFYSYGEISPFSSFLNCQLHNQTMTVTTLWES